MAGETKGMNSLSSSSGDRATNPNAGNSEILKNNKGRGKSVVNQGEDESEFLQKDENAKKSNLDRRNIEKKTSSQPSEKTSSIQSKTNNIESQYQTPAKAAPGANGKGNTHSDDEDENNDDDDDEDDDDEDDNDNDNDDGDDDASRSNNSSNSSSDSEDEDEDDDDDDNGPNGLSDYERLRLERIKRNQQYLASLGLEGKNGHGVLGGEKKKTPKRRKSLGSEPSVTPTRSSLSRSSKKKITYNFDLDIRALKSDLGNSSGNAEKDKMEPKLKQPSDPNKKPRKERAVKYRMARFIYDEFKRIKSKRNQNVRVAKKNLRSAEKHVKHWRKQLQTYRTKHQRIIKYNEMVRRQEQERRDLGGFTKVELLQQIDQRHSELYSVVAHYDRKIQEKRKQEMARRRAEEEERQKEVYKEKMIMIDALDRFPKLLKDASSSLNVLLLNRSPRDAPPPKRSKRKPDEALGGNPAKVQKVSNNMKKPPTPQFEDTNGLDSNSNQQSWTNVVSAAATMEEPAVAASPQTLLTHSKSPDAPSSSAKQPEKNRKRDPVGRNVGGWISPRFSKDLDRSWLERQVPPTTFDLSTYVPQIGDTILYYPAAHKAFLDVNPDKLGTRTKNLCRDPLWVRAKRALTKAKKEENFRRAWWTEEWIREVGSGMGTYPIVCRVQHTHCEFPPDPYMEDMELKKDDNGKTVMITTEGPSPTKRKKKNQDGKPQLRLAVMLRPLSTAVPPVWDCKTPGENNAYHSRSASLKGSSLELPPAFTVVTCPSTTLEPFIIPFSWAYCLTHSASIGDEIAIRNTEKPNGKIKSFRGIRETHGSFRLDDKIAAIHHLLSKLKMGQSIQSILGSTPVTINTKSQTPCLPLKDASIIVDFLGKFMDDHSSQLPEESSLPQNLTLWDLIRSTLPLSKGIGVVREISHRQTVYYSRWELSHRKKPRKRNDTQFSMDGLLEGFPRKIDYAVRVKLVCTIQEFLRNNDAASVFVGKITDAIAPGYSCAVPVAMYFNRVLARLKAVNGRCYYTSLDSVLSDIQAIADNCLMYNDPESPLVASSQQLIPALKRILSDMVCQHVRERQNQLKAEEERKRFVMRNCDSAALELPQDTGDGTNTPSKRKRTLPSPIPCNINTPFKLPIHREWLQRIQADASWSSEDLTGAQGSGKKCILHDWVPQRGDHILYNRSFHSSFVKGHYDALSKEHCFLPIFHVAVESPTSPKSVSSELPAECLGKVGIDALPDDEFSSKVQRSWLWGTVIDVRSTFPRQNVLSKDGALFDTASPVLVISVRFPYSWCKGETHTICWRPCKFYQGNLGVSSHSEGTPCNQCGLHRMSFLLPAWCLQSNVLSESGVNENVLPLEKSNSGLPSSNFPTGIDEIERQSILRCFDFLKQRCLDDIDPDFVDPQTCLERVEKSSITSTSEDGLRSLPSFEDYLCPTKKSVYTGKNENGDYNGYGEAIEKLCNLHYLPPWVVAKINQKQEPHRHEMNMATPNICLELVRLRLKNGYYRQRVAILNDLSDAYSASVVFILSEACSQREHPLSIRKIARHLLSSKGNSKFTTFVKPGVSKKKKKKDDVNSSSVAKKESGSANLKTSQVDTDAFSDDDSELILRIDKIRKLYSTAIACVTDRTISSLVFGLSPRKQWEVEKRNTTPALTMQSIWEEQEFVAVQRVRFLLAAISRDASSNRFPLPPRKKLRIKCDETIVTKDLPMESTSTDLNGSVPNESAVTTIPDDFVRLERSTFEKNDDLARMFFGRPGRNFPCIRCQVYGVSFLTCRVIRGHSNPDFSFVENLQKLGGVNNLLQCVYSFWTVQGNSMPLSVQTLAINSMNANNNKVPEASGASHMNASKECTRNESAADKGVVSESARKAVDVGKDVSAESSRNEATASKISGDDQTDPSLIDPSEYAEKAEAAILLASYLFEQAHLLTDFPVRLGDTFIKDYFPIDPDDGHYVYCIVCGLSGNLLCCDGCENVVHPNCVGLMKVPDDDWFCKECVTQGRKPSLQEQGTKQGDQETKQNDLVTKQLDFEETTNIGDSRGDMKLISNTPINTNLEVLNSDCKTTGKDVVNAGNGSSLDEKRDGIVSDEKNTQKPKPEITDEEYDKKEAELIQLICELDSLRIPPTEQTAIQKTEQNTENGKREEESSNCPSKSEATNIEKDAAPHGDNGADLPVEHKGTDSPIEKDEDDVEESLDPADQEKPIPLGTIFVKTFEVGDFEGKVIKLPTKERPYYGVEYEDGDAEDLSRSELLDLLPDVIRAQFECLESPPSRKASIDKASQVDESNAVDQTPNKPTTKRGRTKRAPDRFSGGNLSTEKKGKKNGKNHRSPRARSAQNTRKRKEPDETPTSQSKVVNLEIVPGTTPKRGPGRPRKHPKVDKTPRKQTPVQGIDSRKITADGPESTPPSKHLFPSQQDDADLNPIIDVLTEAKTLNDDKLQKCNQDCTTENPNACAD